MTSPHPRTSTRFAVALASLALGIASCGGTVVLDETDGHDPDGSGGATPGPATGAAGGDPTPLTCDVVEGPIDLVPDDGNPAGCREALSCTVWFGHGQHMSCPGWDSAGEPDFAECTIRDCICSIHEVEGFSANFATGEVVDSREPGLTCRYTLEPSG